MALPKTTSFSGSRWEVKYLWRGGIYKGSPAAYHLAGRPDIEINQNQRGRWYVPVKSYDPNLPLIHTQFPSAWEAQRAVEQWLDANPMQTRAAAGHRHGNVDPPQARSISDYMFDLTATMLAGTHGVLSLHDVFGVEPTEVRIVKTNNVEGRGGQVKIEIDPGIAVFWIEVLQPNMDHRILGEVGRKKMSATWKGKGFTAVVMAAKLMSFLEKKAIRPVIPDMGTYVETLKRWFLTPTPDIYDVLRLTKEDHLHSDATVLSDGKGLVTFQHMPKYHVSVTVLQNGVHLLAAEIMGKEIRAKFPYKPPGFDRGVQGVISRYISDHLPAHEVFHYQIVDRHGSHMYDTQEELFRAFPGVKYLPAPESMAHLRPELRGQPVLRGLIGPMWGGLDGGIPVIRYETEDVNLAMSRAAGRGAARHSAGLGQSQMYMLVRGPDPDRPEAPGEVVVIGGLSALHSYVAQHELKFRPKHGQLFGGYYVDPETGESYMPDKARGGVQVGHMVSVPGFRTAP